MRKYLYQTNIYIQIFYNQGNIWTEPPFSRIRLVIRLIPGLPGEDREVGVTGAILQNPSLSYPPLRVPEVRRRRKRGQTKVKFRIGAHMVAERAGR